ncbi:hypothetical protein Bca4012_064992 [Brassica carinata]|uniref:Uncharacterized protein n=1 Tax=Brassica carinata TaxID=52824 RepID=A0A8X7VNC8_BRACI|nr:hypothetical protein Bca52824_017449 [Brassica carinata]
MRLFNKGKMSNDSYISFKPYAISSFLLCFLTKDLLMPNWFDYISSLKRFHIPLLYMETLILDPLSNSWESLYLNLSFSGLIGHIDPAFSNLTSIKKLDLAGNNLTGEVPDFLANLPNLSDLNLEGNQLTGIVPHKLLERSKDGTLSLRYGGNPELCSLDSCENTKKNHGYIIPVVASVIGLLLLLAALALFWHFKKISHKEVVSITNNFGRVLGKGGFGVVYHGISDGDQVAVKILSEGYKEFRAEVEKNVIYIELGREVKDCTRCSSSDVYSFGVVLLEVITGQPVISYSRREKRHISDQVSSMLAKGNFKGIDQRLGERYDAGSAWKMAELSLACTEQGSTHRPTMNQVVMGLNDHNKHGDLTKMVSVNLNSEMVPQAR